MGSGKLQLRPVIHYILTLTGAIITGKELRVSGGGPQERRLPIRAESRAIADFMGLVDVVTLDGACDQPTWPRSR